MIKNVVQMKNLIVVAHNAKVHVLMLIHLKNYAIICVLLDVFVLMVIYDKVIRIVHVSKKLNVEILKDNSLL
jgi:hypothetical protein